MEVRVKKEECEEVSLIRCLGLQNDIAKAGDKYKQLDLDIWMKKDLIESLERKLNDVELKKVQLEDEVRVLKQKNYDLEKCLQTGNEEHEQKYTELMIENKVLECEKNKAAIDVEVWKVKCEELELRILELQKEVRLEKIKNVINLSETEVNEGGHGSGTPPMKMPSKNCMDSELGRQRESKSGARIQINLSSKGSPFKNFSPTTPSGKLSVAPIDISDTDDDLHNSRPRKRKVANRVTSESESENDIDDNVPLSKLRHKNIPARSVDANLSNSLNDSSSSENLMKNTPKRHLIKPGYRDERVVLGKYSQNSSGRESPEVSKPMNEFAYEDVTDEDEWETESMNGFIVDDSASGSEQNSENDGTCSGDHSDDSQNESESSMGYDEIISNLRRKKKDKSGWEYEADMLADFGKNSKLCMEAVCALYRQQTSEEQSSKTTFVANGRGFSSMDASRGSELADFLTDGDPLGEVKKSVEELIEFDPKGIEVCRKYATHYSKQLFEVYKNKEDPYFRA